MLLTCSLCQVHAAGRCLRRSGNTWRAKARQRASRRAWLWMICMCRILRTEVSWLQLDVDCDYWYRFEVSRQVLMLRMK